MAQNFTDDFYSNLDIVHEDMLQANSNFAALKSSFSGSAQPANSIAGMWWFDTATNLLKIRNEANNAWLSVWDLANNKPVITNLSNEILLSMMNSECSDPAVGTAGLRTLGTSATSACAGNDTRLVSTVSAGDVCIGRNDTTRTKSNSSSYTLIKGFSIPSAGGYRLKFGLSGSGSSNVGYGRLYRNGSAIGSERSVSGYGFSTMSQDITGWAIGDSCELWFKTIGLSSEVYVRDFRIYVETPIIGAAAIEVE